MKRLILMVCLLCAGMIGCSGETAPAGASSPATTTEPLPTAAQIGSMLTAPDKWEVTVDSFEFAEELAFDRDQKATSKTGEKLLIITMTVKNISDKESSLFEIMYNTNSDYYTELLFNGKSYESSWLGDHPDAIDGAKLQPGESKTGFILFDTVAAMEAEDAQLELVLHNFFKNETAINIPLDPALNPESDGPKDWAHEEEIPEDSLYNYTATINGDTFKLPMAYSDAVALGWALDERIDAEEMIDGRTFISSMSIKKGDLWCNVNILNHDENPRPMNECHISYLSYSKGADSSGADFTLPGGLQSGVATKEDVIAINGEPNTGGDTSLIYIQKNETGYSSNAKFEVIVRFDDAGLLSGFTLETVTRPEGVEQ